MAVMFPPRQQVSAFHKAVAERLGLDLSEVSDDFLAHWQINGDDELAPVKVSFTAYLPADEILAMFNGATE